MSPAFVWYDHYGRVLDEARAFYAAWSPWTIRTLDLGEDGPYPQLHDGTREAGGFLCFPEVPPHWQGYVAVVDERAATQRAVDAGATLVAALGAVEGFGRVSVLLAADGTRFSVIEPAFALPDGPPSAGQFSTPVLESPVVDDAAAFWSAVFAWTARPLPDGSLALLSTRGPAATLRRGPAACLVPTVRVDSVDAAMRSAVANGGTDLGAGRLRDPHGALLDLIEG